MADVTVFGDINVDVLMPVACYPESGEDAMASSLTIRQGGSGANTAIVLSKLGLPVQMVGRTGDDQWGEIARQSLLEFGVDARAVSRDPLISTGLIFIPVAESGERTLFSYRGANASIAVDHIQSALIEPVRFLHLSGYIFLRSPQREAAWRLVELARQAEARISLDSGIAPAAQAQSELVKLLPQLSLLVLGVPEAKSLTGAITQDEAVQALLELGVDLVGLKLGSHGCLIADSDRSIILPPFPVQAVDTTGAGDAFSAGLIYSQLKSFNLACAGIFANALGGLATTVLGGGGAFPGISAVIRFLGQNTAAYPYPGSQELIGDILNALRGAE
jgi:ribokinase